MQFNKVLIILWPTKIVTIFCSVSFRPPGLWDVLSSEKLTNTKRELSKASSNILNSVFLVAEVHYFHMNRKERKLKGLSEIRFGSMIFLLRMAGIPLKIKKISTIYAVYMITLIIFSCSTYIGMFVDVYIHWDDLGRAMTSMRMFIAFTNVMWIFLYYR